MAETYLTPSSSSTETEDGKLVYELRDVQRNGEERWKLVAAPHELLDYQDALMEDGSVLVQALPDEAESLLEQKEKLADIQSIIDETQLSQRQAELYAWKTQAGLTVRQAAQEMDISDGNASDKWHTIKQKIQNAKQDQTAELEV